MDKPLQCAADPIPSACPTHHSDPPTPRALMCVKVCMCVRVRVCEYMCVHEYVHAFRVCTYAMRIFMCRCVCM